MTGTAESLIAAMTSDAAEGVAAALALSTTTRTAAGADEACGDGSEGESASLVRKLWALRVAFDDVIALLDADLAAEDDEERERLAVIAMAAVLSDPSTRSDVA